VSDCPVLLSGVRRINSGYFNFKGMVEFRNYKIMRQTSSVIIGWVTRNERDLIIAFVFAIIGAVFLGRSKNWLRRWRKTAQE
jgi:hypothetical protein